MTPTSPQTLRRTLPCLLRSCESGGGASTENMLEYKGSEGFGGRGGGGEEDGKEEVGGPNRTL